MSKSSGVPRKWSRFWVMTVAAALLAVILTAGASRYGAPASTQRLISVRVSPLAHSVMLESEFRNLVGSNENSAETSQTAAGHGGDRGTDGPSLASRFDPWFALTNSGTQPVSVVLEEQDCSCFGVMYDDRKWERDQLMKLAAGQTCRVALLIHPNNHRGLQKYRVKLRATVTGPGEPLREEWIELGASLNLLEDLQVEPQVLELQQAAGDGSRAKPLTRLVAVEQVADRPQSLQPPPSLVGFPEWVTVENLTRDGPARSTTADYWAQKWQFQLRLIPPPLRTRASRIFAGAVVYPQTDPEWDMRKRLTVVINRTRGLVGPERLAVQADQAAGKTTRRVVLRAVDGVPFRVFGARCFDPHVDVRVANAAQGRSPVANAAAIPTAPQPPAEQLKLVKPAQEVAVELEISWQRAGNIQTRLELDTTHPACPVWRVELDVLCDRLPESDGVLDR